MKWVGRREEKLVRYAEEKRNSKKGRDRYNVKEEKKINETKSKQKKPYIFIYT